MTVEVVAALSVVAGVVTALGGREVVAALISYVTGRDDRERALVRELRAERDAAEGRADVFRGERDAEATRVRLIAEHASLLRRMLYNMGVEQLPPWPFGNEEKHD